MISKNLETAGEIGKIGEIRIINLKNCSSSKAMEYLKTCFYGWAAMEQWNPGIHDMSLYFEAYPQAFYVLEVVQKNGLIREYNPAAVLFTPYDADTSQASVGAYISEKTKCRGEGYGYRLWKHVFEGLNQLNQKSVRYLYGVPGQVSNYEKSGFHATHHIIHYSMVPDQKHGPFQTIIEKYNSTKAPKTDVLKYLKTNYSTGFAKFVESGALKKEVYIQISIDPETEEIIGVGMSRPLHDGLSHRYAIVTQRGRTDAADDLFRSLNRTLTSRNRVVIDVRENTISQKTYEYYCHINMVTPKESYNITDRLRLMFCCCFEQRTTQKKLKLKKHGQHWTTEMSTNSTQSEGKLETHAEPSLETTFLRKT